MAPGLSHKDGGIFTAEASSTNDQKRPQAIRSCKKSSHLNTDPTFTTIAVCRHVAYVQEAVCFPTKDDISPKQNVCDSVLKKEH